MLNLDPATYEHRYRCLMTQKEIWENGGEIDVFKIVLLI
jgi:hypothetical protein